MKFSKHGIHIKSREGLSRKIAAQQKRMFLPVVVRRARSVRYIKFNAFFASRKKYLIRKMVRMIEWHTHLQKRIGGKVQRTKSGKKRGGGPHLTILLLANVAMEKEEIVCRASAVLCFK